VKFRYGRDANITHRIDKETSGLVLVAKNKRCEIEIKKMFEDKLVKKTYLAYVKGNIKEKLIIDAPIYKNRDFSQIKLKVVIDKKGKPSKTVIEPIFYDKKRDITLVRAIPLTGRQHQIRAHLFHVKHPIIGDPIYGVETDVADRYLNGELSKEERRELVGGDRLMLHAESLEFKYKNRFIIYSKAIFTL
jgi:23S rRNA pseudouridine1911/1915/1917 synthase